MACEACKGFYRRSLNKSSTYRCSFDKKCHITLLYRNCRYCRFQKCVRVGMVPEGTKVGRKKNIVKQQIIVDKQNQSIKRKQIEYDDYYETYHTQSAKRAHLIVENENSFDSIDTETSQSTVDIINSPKQQHKTQSKADYYSDIMNLNQNLLQSAFNFYNSNQNYFKCPYNNTSTTNFQTTPGSYHQNYLYQYQSYYGLNRPQSFLSNSQTNNVSNPYNSNLFNSENQNFGDQN